jgi:hypothetical protein
MTPPPPGPRRRRDGSGTEAPDAAARPGPPDSTPPDPSDGDGDGDGVRFDAVHLVPMTDGQLAEAARLLAELLHLSLKQEARNRTQQKGIGMPYS